MMLKDLIDNLTEAYNKFGNAEVERANTCCCYGDWEEPITSISATHGLVVLS